MGGVESVPVSMKDVKKMIQSMQKNIHIMHILYINCVGKQPTLYQLIKYGENKKEFLATYAILKSIIGENDDLETMKGVVRDMDKYFLHNSSSSSNQIPLLSQ
jgi:hypothetical protein